MNQVNPKIQPQIIHVGKDQTPVCIIDDFLLDTTAAITEASQLDYNQQKINDGTYYPGVRANVGGDYGMAVLQGLVPIFYDGYQVPRNLTLYPRDGLYSLLTQAEDTLEPLQCIPHFDSDSTFSFAVLHYLNPGDFGGTGFYRHIPSGYEHVTKQRKQSYLTSVQAFINKNGVPKQQYFTHSNAHFELLETIEYKPNRLVIYPATLLHSAFIEHPKKDVNNDAKTGRLSANFFIEFE